MIAHVQVLAAALLASGPEVSLPVTVHLVRASDGSGGAEERQVEAAMRDLSRPFAGSGLRFCLDGPANRIDDGGLYDGAWSAEALAAAMRRSNVPGTVNVYVVRDMVYGGAPVNCGVTCDGAPGIAVRIDCFGTPSNPSTLAHEMGHFLGLAHTHCGARRPGGRPCAHGSDDGIADTPDDPGLRSGEAPDLVYHVGEAPGCGYLGPGPWAPDTRNVMSYSRPECRSRFSDGQRERMRASLRERHADLRRGCPGPPQPVSQLLRLLDAPGSEIADLLALLALWS